MNEQKIHNHLNKEPCRFFGGTGRSGFNVKFGNWLKDNIVRIYCKNNNFGEKKKRKKYTKIMKILIYEHMKYIKKINCWGQTLYRLLPF